MTLPRQKIPLALNTPLDTKSDEFLTPGFAVLENVRHKKTGGLIKRNGYTELTQTIANTSPNGTFTETLSGALALKSFKDELVLLSEDGVFSYSSHDAGSETSSWLTRDYVNRRGTTGSPVVRKDSSALSCTSEDYAAISEPDNLFDNHYVETTDFRIFSAYGSVAGATTVSIMDKNTGALIVQRQFSIQKSMIVTDSTYLYVIGQQISTNNLVYYAIPLLNLNASVSPVTAPSINFTTNSITSYSAVSDSTQVFLVAAKLVGAQYFLAAYVISGATCTNTHLNSAGTDYTTEGPLEMRIVKFQSNYKVMYASRSSSSPEIRHVTYNFAGGIIAGPTSIGESGSYLSIGADANNTYAVYNNFPTTKLVKIDSSETVTISTFSNNPLYSQSNIVIADGRLYVAARSRITNIGYLLLMQLNLSKGTTAALFGKALDFTFRQTYINGSIINTAMTGFPNLIYSGNALNTSARIFNESVAPGEESDPAAGPYQRVAGVKFVFNASYKSVSVNSGLIVSGSIAKLYDGASYTELGFLESPRVNAFTAGVVGLEFPAGTYGMAAVYTWIDAIGNKHRSAPAFATLTAAGGLQTLDFVVEKLYLTEKENHEIEFYLTEVNGTIYYKSTITAATGVGAFNQYAVTSQEVLYTQSGELENDAPFSSIALTYFKNRVFAISKNSLQYSKPISAGAPVEFNGDQVINLEAEGGDATGVYGMDNSLIIFKKNALYLLSGEGPNALGQQNDYGNPQLITGDTGNIDLNSIVAYPFGLLFKSKKGIYEINRGLAVQYIGAQVADFNQYDVVSSTLLPEVNEIRFVLSNGQIITFDYFERQWEIDTVENVISGVSHNNVYYQVNSDSVVSGENSLFWDAYNGTAPGTPYSAKIVTNWIQVGAAANSLNLSAGVQQWQRLYKIIILGRYKSEHTLKVSLSYNYDDTVVDFATIPPDPSGRYQYVVSPTIQKCQAVKITIEDNNTSATNGESMELSSVLLEVGLKNSVQKQTGDGSSNAAT